MGDEDGPAPSHSGGKVARARPSIGRREQWIWTGSMTEQLRVLVAGCLVRVRCHDIGTGRAREAAHTAMRVGSRFLEKSWRVLAKEIGLQYGIGGVRGVEGGKDCWSAGLRRAHRTSSTGTRQATHNQHITNPFASRLLATQPLTKLLIQNRLVLGQCGTSVYRQPIRDRDGLGRSDANAIVKPAASQGNGRD